MECNIAELIVMTRYSSLLETRIVLRTMPIAGALADAAPAAGARVDAA